MFHHSSSSAFTNVDEAWQKQWRLRLFHRCMDHVIAQENELCKVGRYFRFADKKVRFAKCFHYFTSMNGLEVASTALSSVMDCSTCECPRELLGKTDTLYPIRDTYKLRAAVEKACSEFLNPDESIKDRYKLKVDTTYMISYMISHHDIIYEIIQGFIL